MKSKAFLMLLVYVAVSNTVSQEVTREACVSLQPFDMVSSLTTRTELELMCEDTFDGRGVIAIRQVFHGQASSCKEDIRQWTCVGDTSETSLDILEANGRGFYATSVSPKRFGWCPGKSNHVLVRYTCHDEPKDICSEFDLRTRSTVDLVSPGYPYPQPDYGFLPGIACACNVTVRDNAQIQVTVIDLDLIWGTMGTCAEEILNGSLEDHHDIWEILYYTQGACTRTDLPKNITLPKSTWTFVYSRHAYYVTRPRRGAWITLRGVSSEKQPAYLMIKCAVLPEVTEPPYEGSGHVTTESDTTTPPYTMSPSTISFSSTTGSSSNPAGAGASTYIGVIAGVAVGGFLVLVLFAVGVFICLRRRSVHERQDTESKLAKLPPAVPALPVRNSPHKVSLGSRTSSCPEYFEPIDEGIYCVPEDVQSEAAKYAVLDGIANPAHDYLSHSAPVTESPYENKRKLTKEISVVSGEYDSVEEFSDYENTRLGQEQKSAEYCHLPPGEEQTTKATDYEKLAVGNATT